MGQWRLFPELSYDQVAVINLDQESKGVRDKYANRFGTTGTNPFLKADACGELVEQLHRRDNVSWSYGGYMENRCHLLAGSYLEKRGNFLHLGIDFSVPAGTAVATTYPGKVLLSDDDRDLEHGWGPRLVIGPTEGSLSDLVFIYAHLHSPKVTVGQQIAAGTVLASVGAPPYNGQWWPHLHLQAMRRSLFEEYLQRDINLLDGYGLLSQETQLRADYPDPIPLIGI